MPLQRTQIKHKKRLLSAAIISGIAPAIISGIHNSEGFEDIAKLVTGRETDFNKRVYPFGGDAYTSNVANS